MNIDTISEQVYEVCKDIIETCAEIADKLTAELNYLTNAEAESLAEALKKIDKTFSTNLKTCRPSLIIGKPRGAVKPHIHLYRARSNC